MKKRNFSVVKHEEVNNDLKNNRSAGFVILWHIQLKFTKKIYNISQ